MSRFLSFFHQKQILLSETVLTGPTSPLPSPGSGSETAPGLVTQPKKIRGVGFGDIFKEGSVKLRTRTSNSEIEEKKPEKVVLMNFTQINSIYSLVKCFKT